VTGVYLLAALGVVVGATRLLWGHPLVALVVAWASVCAAGWFVVVLLQATDEVRRDRRRVALLARLAEVDRRKVELGQ
jgi:hypothetical protein